MMKMPMKMDPEIAADWTEASCLFGNHTSISRSEVERVLEDAEVYDPERVVESIWTEISRRHNSLASHPVAADTGHVQRTGPWTDACTYAFQLLLACLSYYQGAKLDPHSRKATKLFEELTTYSLGHYIGGKALNIGFPRKKGYIPRGFEHCLDHLCEKMKERRGSVRRFSSATKDENVDAVAWCSFEDGLPGQLIILLQCATGSNWTSKVNEISLNVWRDYIDWAVDPVKGFAFPFVCPSLSTWRYLSRSGGMLLDRLRIVSLFTRHPDQVIQKDLEQWCVEVLKSCPELRVV
jgi:hypothetical protein